MRTASALAKNKSALLKKKGRPGASGVIFWPSLPYLLLRDRNILLRSAAVSPEIKGFTRALVLRRGGRTDRGLAPDVDRVKSAGVMQIHRPLPFSFG